MHDWPKWLIGRSYGRNDPTENGDAPPATIYLFASVLLLLLLFMPRELGLGFRVFPLSATAHRRVFGFVSSSFLEGKLETGGRSLARVRNAAGYWREVAACGDGRFFLAGSSILPGAGG